MRGIVTYTQAGEDRLVARIGQREVGEVLFLKGDRPGYAWLWHYQGLGGGVSSGRVHSREAACKAFDEAAGAEIGAIMPDVAAIAEENARLRKLLDPFARAAGFYEIESQSDEEAHILLRREDGFSSALRVRDFRAARSAVQDGKAA